MEDHPEMTRTRRFRLLILLLTLVPLTCAWAFLPGRHGMSPSAWSASALPSRLVAPTDTTDTTAVPSSASPQAFGSIDINPGLGSDTFLPDLPHDSLLPGHPRDTLIFEPLDRKGTVGTPSGAVAVSETGAATYTLDIEAPDGGALTPHIALAYDSQQGGYGLAGYGIGLTGFSAITRGGSDLFHDGAQRGVSHTAADNLFLDGKRLVFVSGTHGQDGATYVVEGDPYTRVVLHGDIGAGAPSSWFTVTTPAGMTWEYGRTPDSRLAYTNGRGQARVASWHVSKGTDRHAGTIAYTYATSGLCVRPVSVTYGTNEAQARGLIGKVAFAYRSLGANTRPFTLEDRHGQHDLCLSAVTTSLNDSVYRTYTLTYDESLDLSSGKWTRLTKVEEANGRGEKFPPVKLTWQPLPAFRPAATTLKVPGKDVDQSVTETGKRFLAADLNGDGVADIVRVSSASVPDTDKGGRSLFTRVYVSRSRVGATGEVTYDNLPLVYTLPPGFSAHGIRCLLSGASVMDFDGDGLNDLFFAFGTSSDGAAGGGKWHQAVLYLVKGSDVAAGKGGEPAGQYVRLDSMSAEPLFATLDLDGDGRDEIACIGTGQVNGRYPCVILKHQAGGMLRDAGRTALTLPAGVGKDIKRAFTGDFNNDGLTDLILFYDGGYKVYFNRGGTAAADRFGEDSVACGTAFGDSWRMEQGDFDGDGLPDFVINRRGERTLRIARNNGDGSFTVTGTADLGVGDHASLKDDDRFALQVLDIDHDGRSDVVVCKAGYAHHGFPKFDNEYTGTKILWLLSDGTTLKTVRTLTKTREDDALEGTLFTGDFDGDGALELANCGTVLTDADDRTADRVHFYRTGGDLSAAGRLTGVTDGLGATTAVRYAFATSPAVYTGATRGAYPVNTYTLPLPVVAAVTRPGGVAGPQETRCRYRDLRVHVAGRGMLGFGAVTRENATLGTVETGRVDRWDETLWIPAQTTATTTAGDATGTVTSHYTVAKAGGTHFAYVSHKDITDLDGNTATTDTRYDTAKGVVTEETVRNGGADMYKRVAYADYRLKGGVWLPGRITLTQKHADDAAPHTSVTAYQYDDRGDVTATTVNSGTTLALTTTDTHDAWGNTLTSVTTGQGVKPVTRRYEYDPTGRFVVRAATSPASAVTAYRRDLWGNVLAERDETDPSHVLTTRHTYDGWGRPLATVRPDGTRTDRETGWGIRGDRYYEKVTATGQPPVTTWHDAVGHELSRETAGPKGLKVSTATDYDKRGRVTRVTDRRGKLTLTADYTYDGRGRLAEEVSSTGKTVAHSYANRTETATTAGRSYTKTYDAWGNLVRSEDPAGVTRYRYASVGKPCRVDALGAVTTMAYDGAGNRLTLTDPDAGTTGYTWAADGTPLTETDARGVKTAHTYDDLGRQVKTQVGSQTATRTYGTAGNERLRLVREALGDNTVTYTHDALGRVITERRHVEGGGDCTFTYAYNEQGQLARVTYPGGLAVDYRYDAGGYKTAVSVGDRVICSLDSEDGLRSRTTLLGKLSLVQASDSRGYEVCWELRHGQTVLERLTLDHDGATGNLLSRRRAGDSTETFGYDDLDRLVSVKQDGRETLRMTYAPNGNILSKTGVGAFSYDAETRPHAVTEVENADGSIPRSKLLTAFGDLNRIETVEDEGQGLKQTFAYGPDRQRWLSVLSRGGKEARRTVYAGAYERVTEGGHTREYYYLDGNILAIRENGTVNYYAAFTDRQGNILSVVDESGRKVFDATYDAWGRQTVRLNAIGLSRGYTGHEMMGEFGLINMNGRLYDPTLGRFLSPDNYVQEPDNSQSFNRYSYCLNNPLKYTDPSGELFGIDDLGIALAFAGLSAANSMISAAYSGKSVWKAGAFSLLTSAASYGVGAVFGQTGSFGHELLRAGAHGLADATLSALSGGEFFSSFISSAAASGIGSYAKGVKMSTGMMAISSAAMDGLVAWATGGDFLQEALNGFQIGLLNHAMHDGGFGITYYHDKDGNQCGTISEIVVTPTDKADLFAIAGTVNTVVGSVGSSLKNHGGNSTWGSNYKIYWHTQGRQGFYGNQYVTTTKLSAIGSRISNVAGPIGHALELYDFGKGIVLDYKAGYPNGYNTAIAAAGIACGYIGAKAGAALGAWFGGFGAIPGAIIGGAIGGVVGSFGGSMLGEQAIDYIYGR